MNNSSETKAGICLIIFTLLLLFTVVLHPAGGSIGHLINITGVIIVTHSIALLSLPFGWVGFWGLTRKLGTDHFGSMLAFGMISLGLVAMLFAGATNGLVMPIFLQHYKHATPETIKAIDPVLGYSLALNQAFDYIYTGAFCGAILCWSIAILATRKISKGIGWFGISISLFTAVIFISGVAVNTLQGFRIFVMCILAWILVTGIALRKQGSETDNMNF